jgi:hypothetical protein
VGCARAAAILLALVTFFERPAHGYTDPGSGALIWQMLMAALVGVGFYYRRIVSWFKRGRTATQNKTDLQ